MAIEIPLFTQGGSYSALLVRGLLANIYTEGTLGATSFAVSQRAAGANFTVDVAAGVGVVQGDDEPNQGKYLAVSTAKESVTIAAKPGSNSRYDLVVLRINDPTAGGNAGDNATLLAVTGTVSASPVAPTLPPSCLLLATVGPISSGTSSITNSLIADRRVPAVLAHQVIGSAQLVPGSVGTDQLAGGSVTNFKIAASAVGPSQLANYSITAVKLGVGSVETNALADGAVTEAKLASSVLSGAWANLSLASGWSAVAGYRTLQYKKVGNVVTISGRSIRSGGTSTVGTLPSGFGPSSRESVGASNGSSIRTVVINTDGTVVADALSGESIAFAHVFPA